MSLVGAKQIFFVKTNKILLAQQVATASEGLSQTMWTQYEYFYPFSSSWIVLLRIKYPS